MSEVELKAQWSQDGAIAFECAHEAINHVMAICSAQIAGEEWKPNPDREMLANLNLRLDRLHHERVALRLTNYAGIARLRAKYGAEVREWNRRQQFRAVDC